MKTTTDQEKATAKVLKIRDQMTDVELAETLGICKVTLYRRLKSHHWKKPELALIRTLKS